MDSKTKFNRLTICHPSGARLDLPPACHSCSTLKAFVSASFNFRVSFPLLFLCMNADGHYLWSPVISYYDSGFAPTRPVERAYVFCNCPMCVGLFFSRQVLLFTDLVERTSGFNPPKSWWEGKLYWRRSRFCKVSIERMPFVFSFCLCFYDPTSFSKAMLVLTNHCLLSIRGLKCQRARNTVCNSRRLLCRDFVGSLAPPIGLPNQEGLSDSDNILHRRGTGGSVWSLWHPSKDW